MGQASDDSASPPDVAPSTMTVHIVGDATTTLRSQKGKVYNFTQVFEETAMATDHVVHEVHCAEGSQLLSLAQSINGVAERFDDGQCPDDHVCIVIWSGTDFSWEPVDRLDVLATNREFLVDKAAVLKTSMMKFQRSLFVICGSAEFYEMVESPGNE